MQSKKKRPRSACDEQGLWHKLDPPWQVDTTVTKITNEDSGGLSNILTLIVATKNIESDEAINMVDII